MDSNGDFLLTGSFVSSMTLDVGGAATTITSVSNNTSDVFIMKIDPATGNTTWLKQIGGAGANSGLCLATKSNNNILIGGRYKSTLDANPDTSSTANFALNSQGGFSVFLLELDTQGDFVDAFSIDSGSDMELYDIELDASENIYLTGPYKGTANFDMKSGTANSTSNGGQDCYIAKYSPTKDLIWTRNFGGTGLDQSFGVEVGPDGSVYTSGRYSSSVDFNTDTGVVLNITANSSQTDMFIHKLDSSGAFEFVHTFSAVGNDIAKAIDVDTDGNLYVLGSFNNTVDFDPTTGVANLTANTATDGFLIKFSAQLTKVHKLETKIAGTIFPNPVQNQLFINFEHEESAVVSIIDLSGKVVKSITQNNVKSIDVSNLNQGVYLLKIHTKKGTYINKFIKK